ncbi:hypothetical protein R1flu_003088 [Riccia fluitans]|uniref:Uncharacterized protein n=1 Tax=Riccia fluitans TaxID=41844 RepID=A0ABD1Y7Z8_9MARC
MGCTTANMNTYVILAGNHYRGANLHESIGPQNCATTLCSGDFVTRLYQDSGAQSSLCKLSAHAPGGVADLARPRRLTNGNDASKCGSRHGELSGRCCQVSGGLSSSFKHHNGIRVRMDVRGKGNDLFRDDSEDSTPLSGWNLPGRHKRIPPAAAKVGDRSRDMMTNVSKEFQDYLDNIENSGTEGKQGTPENVETDWDPCQKVFEEAEELENLASMLKRTLLDERQDDDDNVRDKGSAGLNRSRRRTSGLAGKSLTAADLANGLLDVQGWKVLRYETGENIGVVDEIIHIGSPGSHEIYESVLKLVQLSTPNTTLNEEESSDEEDGLEFLVPLVEDIVKGIDIKLRCLFIKPPEGLLELARIPEILRRLEPQLLKFCQHQSAGIQSCLDSAEADQSTRFSEDARQLVAWSRRVRPHSRDIFMPTRRQLLSAGRHDLVEEIMAAGGFLSVAQALRLRSRRRPVGFWEDLRNLDAEIEWFVSGCWVVQRSPETGEDLYYNQVTNEYSRHRPSAGNVSNPVPVSHDEDDIGTAVMPRQQHVLEAGRYDLHHAILMHGGYKLVAQELGRQPVPRGSTKQAVAQIRRFMEDNSFSTIPSFEELKSFRRYDLVYSLRKLGGINSVAQMMELRPKRYGKGQWYSLDFAAAAVRSYMCNELIVKQDLCKNSMDRCDLEDMVWDEAIKAGTLEIPSQEHVLKDGRSDLRYLLQKYGRKDLAKSLGISTTSDSNRQKASLSTYRGLLSCQSACEEACLVICLEAVVIHKPKTLNFLTSFIS